MGSQIVAAEATVLGTEGERWRLAGERLRRLSPWMWRKFLESCESVVDLAAETGEFPPMQ